MTGKGEEGFEFFWLDPLHSGRKLDLSSDKAHLGKVGKVRCEREL